jgi:hypothetical protein
MNSKLAVILAPLLTIVALAAPAVAQAEGPRWLTESKMKQKLVTEPTPVVTSGSLAFHFVIEAKKYAVKCTVKDNETISNEPGPEGGSIGVDEMTQFELIECHGKSPCLPPSQPQIVAAGLPWPSHLVAGNPIRDEIDLVKLEASCGPGTPVLTFEGTLTPAVENSALAFGAGSGVLTAGTNTLSISGKDKMSVSKGVKVGAV